MSSKKSLATTARDHGQAERLREIMGKLKLTVNEEKTRICKVPKRGKDTRRVPRLRSNPSFFHPSPPRSHGSACRSWVPPKQFQYP
jgi:hypothetical protein